MSARQRNNVNVVGREPVTMVFAHGFGCDQSMWRFIVPHFEQRFSILLYDLTGSGDSDWNAYCLDRHATLHGHADDLLQIIDECVDGPVIFIGHSVSAMIGMLAANRRPAKFLAQVMIGPSPCYINDDHYLGGFNAEDIEDVLDLMQKRLEDWTATMAPVIMGAPEQPGLRKELADRFNRNDPNIMRHFGRVTFLADHRADLRASTIPTLILQCSDDLVALKEVGEYLHAHLANSTLTVVSNVGHCPHMSAPGATVDAVGEFLAQL
jgi:sigma-B regulation protein RsbQ